MGLQSPSNLAMAFDGGLLYADHNVVGKQIGFFATSLTYSYTLPKPFHFKRAL